MAKGRTKNKRARKPDRPVMTPADIPRPYPIAYFCLSGNRNGFAEAGTDGRFYHPCEPVTRFRITVIPHLTGLLDWTRNNGWTGNITPEDLRLITPAIEKSFSPLKYRFRLEFD